MTPEQIEKEKQIKRDRGLPHAAVVVDVVPTEEWEAASLIEEGMCELNDRAMAAGMVIVSSTVSTQSYVVLHDGKQVPHVVYIIVAQWVERDKLESLQRQQSLMGGPNGGGPRRVQ